MPISYTRTLDIDLPPDRSAFLWGARQTGKSTWLRHRFPDSPYFDLLDSEIRMRLTARPRRLGEMLNRSRLGTAVTPVIVDEIQKVPGLLDEVHRLIETRRLSFILCGSSARKLRRAGVNLLGGRAWRFEMFPLTSAEIPDFDLLTAMRSGLLPGVYNTRHPHRSLAAYVRDYLAHEVVAEGLARDTPAFLRFFEALRFSHGELLNYASIARDCGVGAKTIRTYFEILRDTLVGYLIYPFHRRAGRQTISAAPRFYLLDVGIAGHVCRRRIEDTAGSEFGRAFV